MTMGDDTFTDIDKLRICASIQSHSIGLTEDWKYSRVPAKLVKQLRAMDQHSQDIRAGEKVCFVEAEKWPSLTARGLCGVYVVKDQLYKPPKVGPIEQFTDALRRVFSFMRTRFAG